MVLSFLKRRKHFIVIIILAIASFIFWNYPVFGYKNLQSDSNYYDRVAVNFLNGAGFTDAGEFQNYTLGYETFLATVYTFFGHSANAVRGVQGILFICIILLIFVTSKRFFGEKISFLIAVFSALFYVLPLSAGVIGKENLTTFLILIFFFYFLRWLDKHSIENAIFSGFFLGFLSLTNGIAKFLFIPFFIILIIVEWKKFVVGKNFKSAIILFLTYIITVSPYFFLTMRYESSLGVTSQGGGLYARAELMETLWDDYGAHFIGMSFGYYFSEKIYPNVDPMAFREVPKTDKEIEVLKKEGYPEYKWQQILFEKGLKKIVYNPHKYILMSALDFLSFNSPLVPHGEYRDLNFVHLTFAEGRYPNIPDILKIGYLLTIRGLWYAFLILTLYGIVSLWRKEKILVIFFLLFILYFNGLYTLVHALPRYAIPIYPLYIMFFSAGLKIIIEKLYEKISHSDSSI